ncbi:MAG: replication protein [Bdellovibrionaceae bacterium]|nr:replication protein [Pseudobdellovibrionaceae bacterium]
MCEKMKQSLTAQIEIESTDERDCINICTVSPQKKLQIGRPKQPVDRKYYKPIPEAALYSVQLRLFQDLLANSDKERNQLSNTIHMWDSIPRYSVAPKTQNRLRSNAGHLKTWKHAFRYGDKNMHVTIYPARIELKDEFGMLIEKEYYPSANEELVEEVLRKFATDKPFGYLEQHQTESRSGVVFTLYMLREELARRGHTRSYYEIIVSLQILAKSSIEIRTENEYGEYAGISAYLPVLVGVSRKTLETDPEAKWIVQFHYLVTHGIQQYDYRQFSYCDHMSLKSPLARWIHKWLINRWVAADRQTSFKLFYSTVKRDSAMFNGNARVRAAINDIRSALNELKPNKINVILNYREKITRGPRNKIENVEFLLDATPAFIQMAKAANKRKKNTLGLADKSS